MLFLTTHKQTLIVDKNIRIRKQLKDIITSHMIRNTMIPRCGKLELHGHVMAFVKSL